MKTLKLLFAAAFAACCVTVAEAADPIPYLDWDPVQKQMTNATCTAYEVVTDETVALAAGTTYVVTSDVTVSGRMFVAGGVENPTRLILCDGAKLTAAAGVTVTSDGTTTNALVICGQAGGTGALAATGGNNMAGIGGGYAKPGGCVTINGGVVTAEGGEYAAGIGGGNGGLSEAGIGGVVTINGGTVVAKGGLRGGGIGGGMGSVGGGIVTINGGAVTAEGGANAAAIGGDAVVFAAPGTLTFGASFAGGVRAGDNAESAVFMTTAAYAADHSAGYATMPAEAPLSAKVVVENGDKTLRFVYDREDYDSQGKTWYSIDVDEETVPPGNPAWHAHCGTVTNVVFDPSFADCRPKNCDSWFCDFKFVVGLEGLENLDTSETMILESMFYGCSSLTSLDLSNFDTSKVTDMSDMFDGCSSLMTITVSEKFVTTQVASSSDMFNDCTALVGGSATAFDASKTDKEYAWIDGKNGLPGYFTGGQLTIATSAYASLNLVNDLDIVIPGDVDYAAGDKVTVKVEGLAKGLKVVPTQQKETTGKKAVTNVIYTIEGVPTETIDFDTQTMYARVTTTYKDKTKGDKGKVESLQPIVLSIAAPEPAELTEGALNQVYEPVDIAALWPEVADAKVNPKDWSFKGWPAGLKYNATAKDASWSYKDGKTTVKTNAAPYTVYGTPTKAGEYTLTATHKRKLADGKTTVNETYSAVLTIWGDDGSDDYRYTDQAYVATATKVLSDVTAASGLPTGIKFTKTDASLSGTPTKSGVFAVTLTKTDKSKETFLWRVLPGENDGFLGTMDWEVEDSAVTVMAGVIRTNWTCNLPADAKVTATGLPSGLKLAQDKDTKAWSLSGTPTKEGNYVVTFKTVRNGVTVTERLAIVVEPNEWTGNWYGMQTDFGHRETLGADVTVSANGTVKLVFTEASTNYNAKGVVQSAVKKTTVTVKNLDANGKTATLTLPKDKKDPLSVDRICILDFDEAALSVDGELRMFLGDADTSAPWPDITTVVLEETAGGETNAYGYMTATYKSGKFTLSGKLWDGTAVKGTVYALSDGCVSPVLVTDKAKNAVSITLGTAEDLLVFVRENGELVTVGRKVTNGYLPLAASFAAADLKSKKFNQLSEAESLVILTESGAELPLVIPEKDLKASVSAQGLVKFTITDEDGWKWVSELLPIDNDGELQFRGIATGTKRGEPTRYRPVWTEVETEDPGVQLWEDGPYWAACNVGAANPEDPGYYFWWGDTGGYRRNADNNGWISVRDSTPFSFEAANVPTCTGDRAWLQSEGYIDSTGNLVAAHDAATAYLGAPWRMPTSAEIDAILDKCDCAILQQDGKWLFRITGRGDYASNSIVLPAAGYGNEASLFGVVSDCLGKWWSSTYYDDPACPGYANGFSILWYGGDACSLLSAIATPRYGYSIRPVRSAE